MATHIKLPYSETSGHIPSMDRIHAGELWINGADNLIGTKKQDGTIVQFAQFTPSERQTLLSTKYIPKSGFVDQVTFGQLPSVIESPTITINDNSDTLLEYSISTDTETVNINIEKTTGHKATKLVITKPAEMHCTLNWSGVDIWLSSNDQPVFGTSTEPQELCVAIFTSKTNNCVNVIYNTENDKTDEGQAIWGSITGDITDQTDLANQLDSKADKTSLEQYLPKSGGEVSGPLIVQQPTESNHAATKQYVDMHVTNSYFATCATEADTSEKVVDAEGFVRTNGARITILFTNGNTAADATLNVNSTGGAPIWYCNQQLSTSDLLAGVCTDLIFDGTNWVVVGALPTPRSYSTTESDSRYALKSEALAPSVAAETYATRVNPNVIGTLSIHESEG